MHSDHTCRFKLAVPGCGCALRVLQVVAATLGAAYAVASVIRLPAILYRG